MPDPPLNTRAGHAGVTAAARSGNPRAGGPGRLWDGRDQLYLRQALKEIAKRDIDRGLTVVGWKGTKSPRYVKGESAALQP